MRIPAARLLTGAITAVPIVRHGARPGTSVIVTALPHRDGSTRQALAPRTSGRLPRPPRQPAPGSKTISFGSWQEGRDCGGSSLRPTSPRAAAPASRRQDQRRSGPHRAPARPDRHLDPGVPQADLARAAVDLSCGKGSTGSSMDALDTRDVGAPRTTGPDEQGSMSRPGMAPVKSPDKPSPTT